jgi:TRAP-type uncharacterized transport system fused permease subunit
MAAHLFIFYFACMSALTPPVALASFAAAAIAGARSWDVGWQGLRFALAGFLIPYMFVYGPAMLLKGTGFEIFMAVVTGLLGTLALGASVQGYLLKKLGNIERLAMLVAALALIKPGWITDLIGFCLLAGLAGYQLFFMKNSSFLNKQGPPLARAS